MGVKCLHRATTRDAWLSIRKTGIIPGHGAERQTRKEAFFSSRPFANGDGNNPRTKIKGYKFDRKKKQVDVIFDMRAATVAGCDFWPEEQ
eukprot:7331812-Pyramimonas_sp.AAC.1